MSGHTHVKKDVTLTINGRQITVDNKSTILEAARKLDIHIPTLCHHKRLHPIGSCRVCLVQIEGIAEPVTSCDTPVNDGMVVETTNPELERLRRQAIQFILLNHPLDCPVCDKAGECELQDITYKLDVHKQEYMLEGVDWAFDKASPLIYRSDGRCIRCGRCVAICAQVQNRHAIDFLGRGYHANIRPREGELLDCEFCGQCISVCPVGALIAKPFLHQSRVWDLKTSETVCAFCGAGCAVTAHQRDEQLYRLTSDRETTHNKGDLCTRGRFGFHYTQDEGRFFTAKVKKGDGFEEMDIESAVNLAASKFSAIAKEHGAAAVAGIGSSRMTNEDAFNFAAFIKDAVGSPNLDTEAGLGYRQILERTFGRPLGTYNELEAADGICIFGSDFAVEMPVPSLRVIAAAKERDAHVLVAAPYTTKLHGVADFPIVYKPGTEKALAYAMIRLAAQAGLLDDSVKVAADAVPQNVQSLCNECGVDKAFLEKAVAALFGAKTRALVIGPYGYGDCTVRGSSSLLARTLTPSLFFASAIRANMQGVTDMGCFPAEGGKSYRQILSAVAAGEIKALWVAGSDPAALFGKQADLLSKLELLVVQDAFFTKTAQMAHVALPAKTWSEKAGTYTSGEARIQALAKSVVAKNDLKSDGALFALAARALDKQLAACTGIIANQIQSAVAGYSGHPSQLPLFADRPVTKAPFYTPANDPKPAAKAPAGEFPFFAVSGASLFLNGTVCARSKPSRSVCPEPYAAANPSDLDKLGAADGRRIKVSTYLGAAEMVVKADTNIPSGVLLVNANFAESNAGGLFERPYDAVLAKVELLG